MGARGTDVPLTIGVPPATAGRRLVPYASAALLVYAINAATCPGDYRHAPRAYRGGAFSFHVATNTILPMAGRRSPFARVCALLYSGKPASRTPARNITLDSATTGLPFGAGVPKG